MDIDNLMDKSFDNIHTETTKDGVVLPIITTKLELNKPLFLEKSFKKPREIIEHFGDYMADLSNEYGILICFDSGMYPICATILGVGSPTSVDMPVRNIIHTALLANATYLVLLHNHPGAYETVNNVKPSKKDIKLIDGIQKCCRMMGMLLYDSIIVGNKRKESDVLPGYYSMREKKFHRLHKKKQILKYENRLAFLGYDEESLEWGRKGEKENDASDYWGFDIDKNYGQTITTYSDSELKEVLTQLNDVSRKVSETLKMTINEVKNRDKINNEFKKQSILDLE